MWWVSLSILWLTGSSLFGSCGESVKFANLGADPNLVLDDFIRHSSNSVFLGIFLGISLRPWVPLKDIIISAVSGAHYKEPTTPMLSQYNDIFIKNHSFYIIPYEIGQFQPTWALFDKDKTMQPHVNMWTSCRMSPLVRSCDCNWSLRLLWGSKFEIHSN